MKKKTQIETTIEYEFTAQEIVSLLNGKPPINLIPEGWEYFSVEVIGLGISKGATVKLKQTASAL